MLRLVVLVLGAALVACATSEPGATIDAPLDTAVVDGPDATGAIDAPDAPVDATDAPMGPDACAPAGETCNGLDDDCDTRADEDFFTLGMPCSAGIGECLEMGTFACNSAGTGVQCSAVAGSPSGEACNLLDDDCDTRTDEGLGVGVACDGPDADLCTEGTTTCGPAGSVVCSDQTGDRVELCNAMDDDCDAQTDEGFMVGAACDGGDTDSCAEGVRVCSGGAAVCNDTSSNNVELCNGLDDDCLAGVDNGYPVGQACTVGVGACARTGANMCNAAGTGVQCSVTPGAPTAETCGDGIDQDCSGADVTCPTNDLPTGALNISSGGVFTVDLVAARNNAEPPTPAVTGCGLTGGRDVYYTFTLPAPEVVYFDTFGSNFDTVLRIYNGSCTSLGALSACHDDACAVTQTQAGMTLAGGTYCVIADQYSSTQTNGSFIFTFTRGGRNGTGIAASSGSVTGNSCSGVNATSPGSTCQSSSTAQDAAHFFTLCPSTVRTVAATTCSGVAFDSVVYLRRAPASSANLGCDDDSCTTPETASLMPATTISGPGLFWLTVDGYQAACGAYTLGYTFN